MVESPQTHGLSGELGWNEADEAPLNGLGSSLLLVATAVYFGSVWLLSGLPPLPLIASRGCSGRGHHKSQWRNRPA